VSAAAKAPSRSPEAEPFPVEPNTSELADAELDQSGVATPAERPADLRDDATGEPDAER
jgi:hypothetical protein